MITRQSTAVCALSAALFFTAFVQPLQADDSAACAPCGTTINGGGAPVTGTWNLAGSPYCVNGSITVAGLTIEPGVTVCVASGASITVLTALNASGSANAPITFTAQTIGAGWGGILFTNTPPGSILSHCIVEECATSAIQISNSQPTIDHCVIRDNVNDAGNGAGINIINDAGTLTLNGCVIENNQTRFYGAGIYAELGQLDSPAHLELNDCIVKGNDANYVSGSGSYFGGGLCAEVISGSLGTVRIVGSSFEANTCTSINNEAQGGGAYLLGDAVVERSYFGKNEAIAGGGSGRRARGGGIFATAGTLSLRNTIIAGNTVNNFASNSTGAGLHISGSGVADVVNSTIARNGEAASNLNFEGIFNSGTLTVRNSILFYNNPTPGSQPQTYGAQIVGTGSTTVDYSCVQGSPVFAGTDNINFAPVFVGAEAEACDLGVFGFSPCIDAGDPTPAFNDVCFPPSSGGARNDMGAHGGPGACPTCGLATVQYRNPSKVNPNSYSISGSDAGRPVMGGTVTLTLDVGSTGHSMGAILGYLGATTTTLNGGQELLIDVACPSGDVLQFGLMAGPTMVITGVVPNDTAFCGQTIFTQGVHIFGASPFVLSNAYDFRVGQ